MNYIDTVIILVLLLYTADGWVRGIWDKFGDLIGFVMSFLLALGFYPLVANLLVVWLNLSRHFAKAVGFVTVFILAVKMIGWIVGSLGKLVEEKNQKKSSLTEPSDGRGRGDLAVEPGVYIVEEHLEDKRGEWRRRWRQAVAAAVAVLDGVLFSALVLVFLSTFPLQPRVKTDIFNSRFGSVLVAGVARIENGLAFLIGGTVNESLTFLTPPPINNGLRSSIPLGISLPETRLTADLQAETEVFELINSRREALGLSAVKRAGESEQLRVLGNQMLVVGLLYEPGEEYLVAWAPAAAIAVEGWLALPEYREILLSASFSEMMVGVVDAGAYGKIFVIK